MQWLLTLNPLFFLEQNVATKKMAADIFVKRFLLFQVSSPKSEIATRESCIPYWVEQPGAQPRLLTQSQQSQTDSFQLSCINLDV